MKNLILILTALLTGCATLGFGDFSEVKDEIKTDRLEKMNESISGEIPVKFTYQPLIGGKHEVFLAGDFNNWSQTETLMREIDGIYETTLYLKKGKYGYKFIVDGQWLTDENADEFVSDGYGGQNSVIFVGNKKDINAIRKVEFVHRPKKIVKEVYLVGSMNDWNQKIDRMLETKPGVYVISLLLKPDEYHYKFLEDGMNWITDENANSFIDDGFGGKNSVLVVDDKFGKVTITKKDGIFLDYGISTLQNLETINPLSSTKIEFKTKAHSDDVESIYLLKNDELIKMNKIAEDGSYDYFQKIIKLQNEDEEFNYCFVYHDGKKEFYHELGYIPTSRGG